MADHSVVAWNELYESEARCHQKGVKSSTGKKVFLVSLFASEGKIDEGKEFDQEP